MIEDIRKKLKDARASVARGDANAALAAIDSALKLARPQRSVSIREAADALGVKSVNTVKQKCRSGAIRCSTVGGRWMVPVSEIDRYRAALATEMGSERPLSPAELDALSGSRSGRPPWERRPIRSAEVA